MPRCALGLHRPEGCVQLLPHIPIYGYTDSILFFEFLPAYLRPVLPNPPRVLAVIFETSCHVAFMNFTKIPWAMRVPFSIVTDFLVKFWAANLNSSPSPQKSESMTPISFIMVRPSL